MCKRNHGFSLIELMVTVAIVAILATIAYPSYRNQILKANRSIAKTTLLTYAQLLEKCYTQYGSYTDKNCSAVKNPIADSADFDAGKKYFAIDSSEINDSDFTITAKAQGSQADDKDCASFSLTNINARTATNDFCWR